MCMMPLEELAKKYQINTQATLMLNALLEVLETIGAGNEPDRDDMGICRNARDAVFEAGYKVLESLPNRKESVSRPLIRAAETAMTEAELWMQRAAKTWDSPNYSGSVKFPIRCPEDMKPDEEPFVCCATDQREVALAEAYARYAYYQASTACSMYDQTTEYGRARAEFARFLAAELRKLLGIPAPQETQETQKPQEVANG